MSSKRKRGGELLPWLTAKQDNKEGRFLQVGNSLLLDKRFQKLNTGARQLYFCIAMEAGGKKTVAFPHSAAKKYGFPKSSFERFIKILQEQGYIERIENGSYSQFAPNVYQISLAWRTKPAPHFGESKALNIPHYGEGKG